MPVKCMALNCIESQWHMHTSAMCKVGPDFCSLRWRHNGRDSVSNHQPHHCLLNRVLTLIKENIKAPRHWPFCGEFTGDRWIPRTNGQERGKCFHLMTSSWAMHIHLMSSVENDTTKRRFIPVGSPINRMQSEVYWAMDYSTVPL